VLPDGGVGPYGLDLPEPLARALLEDGWRWLKPAEKAAVFARFDLADARLSVLARDPDGVPAAQEASFFLEVMPYVPEDLAGAFASWVQARFGARARALGVGERAAEDPDVVSLVALVGDPELDRAARQRGKNTSELLECGDRPSAIQLAIAADAEPALATKLLEAAGSNSFQRLAASSALSYMRGLGSLLFSRYDAFTALPIDRFTDMFARTCDASLRPRLAELVNANPRSERGQPAAAASVQLEACIARRQKLEPAFRKWLKSK
jgi:hypothetical protein